MPCYLWFSSVVLPWIVRSVFVSSSSRFRLVSVFDREIEVIYMLLHIICAWILVFVLVVQCTKVTAKIQKNNDKSKYFGLKVIFDSHF